MKFFPKKFLKEVFSKLLPIIGLIVFTHCPTRYDDSLESVPDANLKIVAAYLFKDNQCASTHQISVPVFAEAKIEDLELCLVQILAQDCAVWNSSANIPSACLAISIRQ